jgi:hypothetical protein
MHRCNGGILQGLGFQVSVDGRRPDEVTLEIGDIELGNSRIAGMFAAVTATDNRRSLHLSRPM